MDIDVMVAVRCESRAGKGMAHSEAKRSIIARCREEMERVVGSAPARTSKLLID